MSSTSSDCSTLFIMQHICAHTQSKMYWKDVYKCKMKSLWRQFGGMATLFSPSMYVKVHSCSVDPQKNRCNYLITHSILIFLTPPRPSLQYCSIDMHISMVGPISKKLAVLP